MFTDNFLRAHGKRTGFPRMTGLYTSPPLITTRERIRINSEPISKELFIIRFFEVWNVLLSFASHLEDMPRYRQLLMLLSFHVFAKANVEVAIYETHSGGEFDCTNVVKPIVTGITTLALDHVRMLGPLIENIAWHKAGIFKPGVPAFSALQESAAITVLTNRAAEKEALLRFVKDNPVLPVDAAALVPAAQRTNASLAIALANAFLEKKIPHETVTLEPHTLSQEDVRLGVDHFFWPGRYQQITDGNCEWFLDVAHNDLSLRIATKWFVETASITQQYEYTSTTPLLRFTNIEQAS